MHRLKSLLHLSPCYHMEELRQKFLHTLISKVAFHTFWLILPELADCNCEGINSVCTGHPGMMFGIIFPYFLNDKIFKVP